MRTMILAGAILLAPMASAAVAQTPAPPPPPAEGSSNEGQSPEDLRVRCRTMNETGSLARSQRVCMTVAEWRRYNTRGNRIARDMVDAANRCGGGAACRTDPP